MPPYVVSGSSDKHLRLFDITTLLGWSTSPEYDANQSASQSFPSVCQTCGAGVAANTGPPHPRCVHRDLVRSVALGEEFVLSGSYDLSIKVRRLPCPPTGVGG
jgi:F-box and WD-40 domain protein 1/11